MSASERKLTVEDLDRFLDSPVENKSRQAEPVAPTWDPTPYLDAAAVLVAFDPFQLRPAGGFDDSDSPEDLLERLAAHSESVVDGPCGMWSLTLPVRRAALRRLENREAMREALESNPIRIDSPVQRMFERVVARSPIEFSSLSREDIAGLITALDWVEGILDKLPEKSDLLEALTRADLLEPMRRLAGTGFVDRERELEQLDTYVFSDTPPPSPLFVFGPGGVGKSSLISRLILDRLEPRSVPFAYIDIDRPTVRPDEPLTLLLEAVSQLQPQLGLPPRASNSLIKELYGAMGRYEATRGLESVQSRHDSSWFLRLFADTLRDAVEPPNRIVFLVDTLEEAQFLGHDVVWNALDFLFSLTKSHESFRVVLSGRALPEDYMSRAFGHLTVDQWSSEEGRVEHVPLPLRPIDLGVLDEAPARELLQSSLKSQGISPLGNEDLAAITGIVGRNPMCLKLAARLLRDQGVEKLRQARSEFLLQLKAEKIQALLYGRILHHVHGEDARSVAYPGLIVRRIAPDVIRDVLAMPCGLTLTAERNEFDIFNDLAREAALVEYDPSDGSLRHRLDVRRAMLADLTDHVDLEVVEQIDRAAVRFYEPTPGAVARGEEIYHRLRLREPTDILNERWLPDAAIRLRNAGEELHAEQRLWLAEKLGITLDPLVRQTASQEAWEAQASRSAERFLQSNEADRALAVVRERSERLPRSALYTLESEALRFLGRLDEALRVARSGVDAASRAGAVEMALDLLLKMVVIEETRGRFDQADRLLDEAQAVAAHSNNAIMRLRLDVTRLRVLRQFRSEALEERDELRREADLLLTDEMRHKLHSHPVLFREVAAELGDDDARIAAAALQTLGLEVSTNAQAGALGDALTSLFEAESLWTSEASNLSRVIGQINEAKSAPEVVRQLVTKELTSVDMSYLSTMLAMAKSGTTVLGGFQNYFRAGVENTLTRTGEHY